MEFGGFANKRPLDESSNSTKKKPRNSDISKFVDLDKSILNALDHHQMMTETQQSEIELSRIIRTKKVSPINYLKHPNNLTKNYTVNDYHKQVIIIEPISNENKDLNIDKFFSNDLFLCLLYTSPSPRDKRQSRMPSSA